MKALSISILKFIRKSRLLFILFLISICSSLLIQFVLNDITEIWEFGAELGKYVYDLSIGFVISYFFFYLVVFRKEEDNKKNVNDRVSAAATLIVVNGYEIFKCLIEHDQQKATIQFPPTESQLTILCSTGNIYKPPFSMSNNSDPSWKDLLLTHKKAIDKNLNRLFTILPYVDSELMGLLTKIEDCHLLWQAEHLILRVSPQSPFADLTILQVSFEQFFDLINQLNTYCDKHFLSFEHHLKMRKDKLKI